MLLGGLWHGAAWRFVIWGGLPGIYLLIERRLFGRILVDTKELRFFPRLVGTLVTFVLVSLTWIFFAAQSTEACKVTFRSLIGLTQNPYSVMKTLQIYLVLTVVILMLIGHWYMRNRKIETVVSNAPNSVILVAIVFMILTIILTGGSDGAFIYFQF